VTANKWHWTEISDLGGAEGGLAGKVFRNIDGLAPEDLLAREVIQNSWDASRKLNETLGKKGKVPFQMEFKFKSLKGKEKASFIESSGMLEIYEQSQFMKRNEAEKAKNEFDRILKKDSLDILICSDFGAHGLYGSMDLKSKSILFRAIFMFGGTGKDSDSGSGGSYGFGKSAFIKGSTIGTVFAYSSFAPFEGDKTTRRFIGASFWGSHAMPDGKELEGRAFFGNPRAKKQGWPFEDDLADKMASSIGMDVRDSSEPSKYGTSLLLVQPQVSPEVLLRSIEKWWWPAIIDGDMEISVVTSDSKTLYPRPKLNTFVAPFLRPYEIASDRAKISSVLNESMISSGWQSVNGIDLGKAVLRVATEEELNLEPEGENDRFPKIALMRSPKMIIEYKAYERRRVPIRGVFVASSGADDHLKNTEPAQHDHWDVKSAPDIPEISTSVAAGVMNKLSTGLGKFIDEVNPPAPNERETLNLYSDLMKGFLSGKKAGPPPAPPATKMPIEIQFTEAPFAKAHKDQVSTKSKFKISISPNSKLDEYQVRVTADFQILEDESDSGEKWPCHVSLVKANKEFKVVSSNELVGKLKRGEVLEVAVESDLYEARWTSKLKPQVQIIDSLEVAK
jgi:hypothetical protein